MVKASLSGPSGGGPHKLIASSPEILCPLEDFILHVGQRISTIENPFAEVEGPHLTGEVDFTRIEDFFRLETKIDAKNDHALLKLALASKRDSFMSGILELFTIPRERLAFIQKNETSRGSGNYRQSVGELGSYNLTSPLSHSLSGDPSSLLKDQKDVVISCQVCGEMFNVLSRFQRHILTHPDPETKKFLCQFCGKRFSRADHLNRHAVLHGDVSLKCLLCGEDFDRASHLDRHRRKNHPPVGQAPSQTPPLTPQGRLPPINLYLESIAEGSGGATMELGGTNLHLLAAVATPENAQQMDPESMLQDLDPEQVVSQILQSDKEHQAASNAAKQSSEPIERPFVCEVCGRKFIRSTHLRRHMRIHTGEKPFACHICGRRYARGDYLRAHINAHRRDRVHKCKHCNEIFHDLMRFAEHCRAVHRSEGEEEDFVKGAELQDTSDSTQIETFTLYEDVPLSSFADGRSLAEAIQVIASPKEDIVMQTAYSSRDLMNPFVASSGSDFLQFVTPAPPTHQSDIILQNGSLSFPESAGHDITIVGGGANNKVAPPLLDPLAHLIIPNTEPLLHNHTQHKLH